MEPKDQNYENKFVILTQTVLGNKQLTPCDKLVLARITGFVCFYESSATTAEFLGIGEDTVKKSKQKLERLGYIRVLEDNGHGKKYAPEFDKILGCRVNFTNQAGKIYQPGGEILPPENKEKNKEKNKKRDESAADDAQNIKKQEHGREDINALIEHWQAETGIDIKGQQNQRRQLYNLLRKYGLDGTKALIDRVGTAIRSGDRFAPQIATPSELTGKYSKLPRLELWENRNTTARPFGQSRGFEDDRPLPSYIAINGFADLPPEHEYSDEERARVSQMFKEARKTLPFMQKKGGQK